MYKKGRRFKSNTNTKKKLRRAERQLRMAKHDFNYREHEGNTNKWQRKASRGR